MPLTPTLWRTCRVLAGSTRLNLFCRIIQQPGQTVGALASAEAIGESRASQELRRLQSRGLVQVERVGSAAKYHPVADPLVPTAQPLLDAMKMACSSSFPDPNELAADVATALSHPRRIAIVKKLLAKPLAFDTLADSTRIPPVSLRRHLRLLRSLGLVRRDKMTWAFAPNRHPLCAALVAFLAERPKGAGERSP